MIHAVDWESRTDAEIAREWRVSRECTRQLRSLHNKPFCAYKGMQPEHRDAAKWFTEHRTEIEGRHAHDAVRLVPSKLSIPQLYRILHVINAPVRFGRLKPGWKIEEYSINWDLPGIWISRVWNMKPYKVATSRSALKKQGAKWFAGGRFHPYLKDAEFLTALDAEIVKAKAAGIDVNEQAIKARL